MLIKDIKKLTYLRNNSKTIYLDNGTEFSWVSNLSIIIDIQRKSSNPNYDKVFSHFNKKQNPVFKYTINKDEILILRGYTRDFIFRSSIKPVKNKKKFRYPQDLSELLRIV